MPGTPLREVLPPRPDEVKDISIAVPPTPVPRQPHVPKVEQIEQTEGVVEKWKAHHPFRPHTGDDRRVGVVFGATNEYLKIKIELPHAHLEHLISADRALHTSASGFHLISLGV